MKCKALYSRCGQMEAILYKSTEEAFNAGVDSAYREMLGFLAPAKEDVWDRLVFSEAERKKYILLSIKGLRDEVRREKAVQEAQQVLLMGMAQLSID